jgi:kinesin family protein 15
MKSKRRAKGDEKFDYLVKASYLEIYNEQIVDLLEPYSSNLNIREDQKKGVYVDGLIEEIATSASDMLDLTRRGARNRRVGSTEMN